MRTKPNSDSLTIIKQTEDYSLVMDPECDMFAVLDDVPNYFIVNEATGKIELFHNSLDILIDAIEHLQKIKDVGEKDKLPSLIPAKGLPH